METRQLTVHPAILFSIIKAQAGTLSKALLEAVMNAVDAGATKCQIKLDRTHFEVKDDGKGFASRDEIIQFFETFGTPHTEGDARYGKFRMGRGQMFAFGLNTWRTGRFTMVVDIKDKGLDYALKEESKAAKGCAIDGQLYEPLEAYQLQDCLNELKKFVQFVEIPVSLNGTVVSKKPEDQKWDLVTPDAYIKLNNSSALSVYNLGVLVRDYGSYTLGSGGIVVSRSQLAVNFARNDILTHTCAVWRRIRENIRDISGNKVAKKASLTDSERQFLADQVTAAHDGMSWETWSTISRAMIVPTAAGRNASINQLMEATVVALVPSAYKRLGDRLHRTKAFFGLTDDTLTRFGCSDVASLLALLNRARPGGFRSTPEIGKFEEFLLTHNAGYQTVLESEVPAFDRLAFKVMRQAYAKFFAQWAAKLRGTEYVSMATRELKLGSSDSALAWTDGLSTIHVEHRFLGRMAKKGANGWLRIGMVLLHEHCHGEADLEGHDHDQDFFERFEDLATHDSCRVADFVVWATNALAEQAVKEGLPLSRSTLYKASLVTDLASTAEPVNDVQASVAAKAAPRCKAALKAKGEGHPVLPGQLSLF